MNFDLPQISSRKNPLVIETAALHDKKNRDRTGLFLLEGEKLVAEAGDRGLPVVRLLIAESKREAVLARLTPHFSGEQYGDLPVIFLSDDCFLKISSEKAPQGAIAVIKHLDFFRRTTIIYDEDILSLKNRRAVLLYGLQDPGNLGAVIRSAAAFGNEVLLLSADCADVYNPKTIRAAMGSLFGVSILVVFDFASAITALQSCGRRVLAAELRAGAIPLSEAALSSRDCILIGNEGHGIPASLSELCDESVYLPISPHAESLNAAVAASVFLWEQSKKA